MPHFFSDLGLPNIWLRYLCDKMLLCFCKGDSVQSTKQIEQKDERSTPHAADGNSTYLSQFHERGKVAQTSRLESKEQIVT